MAGNLFAAGVKARGFTAVNACKGHSSCKTASNACKGQNSRKDQGFVALTKDQCDQVGGTFEAIK